MAINLTTKGDLEKKLKWAFKMYDVDGNGEIDKTEMSCIIQVKHKPQTWIIKKKVKKNYAFFFKVNL